jgi:fructosamine-3-kinase
VSALPPRASWRPLGGGSICRVFAVSLDDGRRVVVKEAPYPVEVEAEGLRALAAAGAPVPEVLAADGELLVLAHVEGPPDWARLGERLAEVHRSTGPAFGWDRDNRIGPLVQGNVRTASWPDFVAEQRIRPHLGSAALPVEVRRRIEAGLDGPLAALLPDRPPASLVHGDLWSGNVVGGRWLIDPAVHHADREYELAFAEVFGGFPDAFWAAYEATWPLPSGWRDRRPALQLPHLLVHVRLFGAGYVGSVVARLDALGW